jgi:magnesium-transporting ATPase (P-type)
MITGDHKKTAVAIARQLGFFKEDSLALSGEECSTFTVTSTTTLFLSQVSVTTEPNLLITVSVELSPGTNSL